MLGKLPEQVELETFDLLAPEKMLILGSESALLHNLQNGVAHGGERSTLLLLPCTA